MTKNYLFIIFFCFTVSTFGQIIDFPDPVFKDVLVNTNCVNIDQNPAGDIDADFNNDGEIDVNEAAEIWSLNINSKDINSVEGIEFFTSLQYLHAWNNNLNHLDVSQNFALRYLDCSSNNISQLVIPNNSNLEVLIVQNNSLTSLDTENLPEMERLNIGSNSLGFLDVTGNELLEELDYGNNYSNGISLGWIDISQNNNLEYLRCGNLQLTDLPIETNPNLERISASNNNLTDVDFSSNTILRIIELRNNLLTEIDVGLLPNLLDLVLEGNQISNLDVSQNLVLRQLDVNDNLIENLDLSNNPELRNLLCNNNNISELNFEENLILEFVSLKNNNLTTLDFSNNPEMWFLLCNSNNLNYLNIKNGTDFFSTNWINLSGNLNLDYICVDESELEILEAELVESALFQTEINSYCSFVPGGAYYLVEGSSDFDMDSNGCDIEDFQVPFMKFKIEDGFFLLGTHISNGVGDYSIPLEEGSYTLTPSLENENYFSIEPSDFFVDFPVDMSPFQQNVCISPNGIKNDLEISIFPSSTAIPGFESSYHILYKNKGNTELSGQVQLLFNDDLMDHTSSSQTADNADIGSFSWNFSNLLPFETQSIEVSFLLNTPTDVDFPLNDGDLLSFEMIINSSEIDETPEDNNFILDQIVVNSFDPNDKTCLQGSEITEDEVGTFVHYLIRFENTGSANAVNIVVKDEIDLFKYDLTSIVPLYSSHDFFTKINDNIVEFIFEDIQLPFDEANNDGFVLFKIKTLPTLNIGSVFDNNAEIFFDFNAPIITNDAITEVVSEQLSIEEYSISGIKLFPIPAENYITIESQNIIKDVSIYDIHGRIISQLVYTGYAINRTIDLSSFSSGQYFIKVTTSDGIGVHKILIK